jgi:hypothetical protein
MIARPASRHRLLHALLALAVAAELGTGLVSARHLRAEQARAAAAAAEKRAEAHYVEALRPLALRVFDAVQPVQDAADAFARPRPGLQVARDDVFAHAGGQQELQAVAGLLRHQRAPKGYRALAVDLGTSLEGLTTSLSALHQATTAPADSQGRVAAFGTGMDQLVIAEYAWRSALIALDPRQTIPAPTPDRESANGRTAPTRGGFIHASDLVCAQADETASRLPRLGDADYVRVNFPKLAAALRKALASLQRTPAPADTAAFGHRLTVDLKGATQLADEMDRLSTALRRGDLGAYQAALRDFPAALDASRAISVAYRSVGVTECAEMFDVDPKGRPKSAPQRV